MRTRPSGFFAAFVLSAALIAPAAVADDQKDKDKTRSERAEEARRDDDRAMDRERNRERERDMDREPMRFRGLDRDGDGRITRAEWRGNDVSFRQHDLDGDGVLSGDEITPSPLTDDVEGEREFNDWEQWWDFHQGQFDSGLFDAMDEDGNQVIARHEWRAHPALFDNLDRGHDGVISRQELEDATYRGMSREELFGRLDSNADSFVQPAEWWWSRESFDLMDRNGDGFLSPAELAPAPPAPPAD